MLGALLIATGSATTPLVAQEGGIEVFAAETLYGGGVRISETYIYKRSGRTFRSTNEVNDPADRLVEEHLAVTAVDYAPLADLTISALFPVVYKRARVRGTPTGTRRVESFGQGDAALLAKYRLHKTDWKRGSISISAIGGLEMPTGETRERDDGARLAPSLQPGSGSWDPVLAASSTLDLNRLRFDLLALGKINTRGAQDFDAGELIVVELDAAYRFLHTKYPGPTASAGFGVQWRHRTRDRADGRTVAASGSDEIRLHFGLGFHPNPSLDISFGVDVPVYRDVRRQQLGLEVRTVAAFGIRF